MIIINNQPIPHGAANHMVDPVAHSKSILEAMDENQDVFNYPNAKLLGFTVRLRSHIVDSAQKLSQSDVKFATFYGSKCNQDYWNLTREGGFLLKSNVRPSLAIQDIFKSNGQYAFECATAMMIILLKASLELFGAERFDHIYQNIYLWDWHEQKQLPLVQEPVNGHVVPGDILYFKNPQVNPRTAWWQGENTIVLPGDLFFGHGVGIQTRENVIKTLNKYRRPGATESAYLLHRATRVDTSFLYMLLGREMTGWTRQRESQAHRRRPRSPRSVIRPTFSF